MVGISMILMIIFPAFFTKVNFSKSINKGVFKVKKALGKELKKKGNDTFFCHRFFKRFYTLWFGVYGNFRGISNF